MWRLAPLLLVFLYGCNEAPAEPSVSKAAQRRQAAQALADQPPKQTVYHLAHGDLIVLDIATVMPGGNPDSQKCFVWRDTEYKAATLQCPAYSEGDVPDIQ